ncbi:amino acid adenylation domain-containing protein [Actinokineospora sp.]|uniref:amino acid adenylation domain-containing protein n=1 Tax=Actinokineospora sp. TaxID=1872133 RepID=UPI004037E614
MTQVMTDKAGWIDQAHRSGLRSVLRANAQDDPDAPAFRFLPPGHQPGAPGTVLSRGDLDLAARALAVRIQDRVAPGGRVLVLHQPGIEFLTALAACFYAGVTAVPCAPPKLIGTPLAASQPDARRFADIGAHAKVEAIVTTAGLQPELAELWGERPVDWITAAGTARDWRPRRIESRDLALIQYTSGSTGNPKGVMVSSGNFIAQLVNFGALVGLPDGGNVVSWMPVFHALGLGHLWLPQLTGGHATFLVPDDFVADPYRWLHAISATPGPVLGGGPNFAYERCVEAAATAEPVDLSGWHAAPSGGERIRPQTVERFVSTFEPWGFRRAAFYPGFGLTEAMQFVTLRPATDPTHRGYDSVALEAGRAVPATAEDRALDLVPCGPAGPNAEVRVVDPVTREVKEAGGVGEVWVGGPVVCQGYWDNPELTEEVFRARLADGTGPFLRTGDIGFLDGGEVVLCGRIKELVIIRGRNLHPQDIEFTVQSVHPALRNRPGAAFAVDGPETELLVVAQSLPEDAGIDPIDLARRIARAVTSVHEVPVHEVLLVPETAIARTASGKVRRTATRDDYLAGKLTTVAAAEQTVHSGPVRQPRGDLHAQVKSRVARALDLPADAVPDDEPLVILGLESVKAIALRYELEAEFGCGLPAAKFLSGTVTELAELVAESTQDSMDWPELVADPEHRHDPFPLTVLQHAYLVGRSPSFELGGTSIHLYADHECLDLDLDRLRAALDRLIERQEMLRSVVSADGYQQISADPPAYPWREYDLRDGGPGELDAHLAEIRAELGHQVMPLDEWPMFDIRVTRVDDRRCHVHVSLDLLIFDVASVRLFFLEWGEFYRDPDVELPPIDVSFRDFVTAVRRIPETTAYQRAREYWLERLDTLPLSPELPLRTDIEFPDGKPVRSRRRHRVDPARWAGLKTRAAELGVTPTAVLLAAYSTVLGAWSGSGHFTVDVPLFSRYPLHPDIEKVLGDFTSVTLLEVDLRPGDGVAGLSDRIQKQLWRDLEHRLFSGVEVAREAAAVRGVPASKFASVVFASIREHGQDQGFAQGEWGSAWLGEMVHAITQTPQVLLDQQVFEEDGSLAFNWDAVEALFPAGMLDDMFDTYCGLLDALADDETAWRTDGFTVLPEAHRQVIDQANDTGGEAPGGLLFDGLVEVARRAPDSVAVVGADRTLTYGELYRHACRYGRQLRDLGAQPGELVAVCLEKSAAQIVAVIAAHLSGAAYLPLDPDLPPGRRAEVLAHSGARYVLAAAEDWPQGVLALRVDLDEAGGEPLEPVQRPEDLAYVLYTSGSTGQPKGVAQSHAATLNTLADAGARMGVGPGDHVLGLSQLGFDLSVWDVFGVLGAGATLVLPEPAAQRDPSRWCELMAEYPVTLWNSVPALLRMLVEHLRPAWGLAPHPALSHLRAVWLSGDWIPVDLPAEVRALAPGARIIASGGPTETAIWCVVNEVDAVDPQWTSIPYGRPMCNHRIHVLDEGLRPCPVGVQGEMYIGGAGLAQGYWRDPERTAESFIVHPATGERLYRSGDLGRWRADGMLDILGRSDFQVKIGGFRIELGEIEARLGSHPEVGTAVVVAAGPDHQRSRLVAAVVPAGTKADDLGTDVELNPLRRLEFTAEQRGRRSDLDGAEVVFAGRQEHDLRPDYQRRATARNFGDEPVELAELAGWLENLRCVEAEPTPKYRYASGGALYPVQVYLYVRPDRVRGLPGGTYYYDALAHSLREVRQGVEVAEDVHVPDNRAAYRSSAFTVFLIAQHRAIDPLYGARARDFCLIETGLITQLLEGEADRHGLGVRQVGRVRDTAGLRAALRLDDGHEVLHGLICGPKTDVALRAADLSTRLREYLADLLPHYMVPGTVIVLDELPLSARGKIDRPAVANLTSAAPARPSAPPASDTERQVADVFAEVLKAESVPVTVNFADLGANSVQLVAIHRRLLATVDRHFPLMTMFDHTTVRRLAEWLDSPERSATDPTPAPRRSPRRRGRR